MSDFNRGLSGQAAVPADMSVDAGLRGFMLGVYNKVGLGLVLSAALAWVTGTYQPVQQLLFTFDATGHLNYTILGMVVAFAPLVILMTQMFARKSSPGMAAVIYWSIVSLIGASMGMLFIIYSNVSIFQTFLVTAAAFGGLSLVGYTTKRGSPASSSTRRRWCSRST
jgi:FtsH-binding integral membrane protein